MAPPRVRVAAWHIAVLVLAVLSLQGCQPEQNRTGALSGTARQPAVTAAAPASASAVAASSPAPAGMQPPGEPAPDSRGGEGPALLALRPLMLPVEGVAASSLVDTYDQPRGAGRHEAIDIMAPKGTRVFAVDDGKVAKLFNSKPGGLTVYQFDPEGNLAYYYAHLDRYAEGLTEGAVLRRGDLVGYVGVTGNSARDAPHLHFAVFRLEPQRQWWKGSPVNPYPALRNAQPPR
jgi:murein DD-endopeptidase MepM/ murein hydrolase activator NlpD